MKINTSPDHFLIKKSDFKDLFNIMKICLFLLFAFAFQLMATNTNAQDAIIELKSNSVTVSQLISEIEKQTDYLVVYSNREVNTSRTVSMKNKSDKVSEYLNQTFSGTDIGYDFEKNYIVLSKKAQQTASTITNLVQTLQQQGKTVRGTVTDSNGEPVIGATIVVQGDATKGTVTDIDGNFILSNLPENAVLQITYVGMKPQEISTAGRSTIDVIMEADMELLDELVVVGYGALRKSDLTGSISTIQGDDLAEKVSYSKTSHALQGTTPGLMVTRSGEGAAESSATIRIRGITSIGDSNPLVIVDGVPGTLDWVNANDVESISVLKDAASASIYGSRAAAGVIVVTTKKAKIGQLSISYNYNSSFEQPTRRTTYTGAVDYMRLNNERLWNDNPSGGEYQMYAKDLIVNYPDLHAQDPNRYPDTNFHDLIVRKWAAKNSHTLSLIAGSEHIKSFFSINIDDTEGLYYWKDYDRYTIRSNNNATINKYLSADVNFNGVYSINSEPSKPISGGLPGPGQLLGPIYAAEWSDGRVAPGKDGENPYATLKYGGKNVTKASVMGGKFQLNFKPFETIVFSAAYYAELFNSKGKNFRKTIDYTSYEDPSTIAGQIWYLPTTLLTESRSDYLSNTLQFLANYNESFNMHNIKMMFGFEENSSFNESLNASRDNYALRNFPYLDLGNSNFQFNNGSAYEYATRSFFGRLNYNFNDTYLFQTNARYDGSSRFHKDYRWGLFPSVSLGWVASNENFMKDLDIIDFLKIRASWGTLGNERIGNYPYQSTISFTSVLLYQGTTVVSDQGAGVSKYAIPDISWETTESYDLGLDMQLFKNKMMLTADIYKKTTKDMLLALEIPDYIGLENPQQNTGDMYTKGWELSVGWRDKYRDLGYSFSAHISDSKSIMGDLGGTEFIGSQVKFEGSEFNEWYGYKSDGLYQTQEEIDNSAKLYNNIKPGDVKFIDISGPDGVPDGIITSAYDRVLLGGSLPRYIYGGKIDLDYKNFDFGIVFQGVGKQKIYISNNWLKPFYEFATILDGNSWSKYKTAEENLKVKYPRFTELNSNNNNAFSDFWLLNGAYFRLKNITLGYTVPQSLTSRIKLSSLRIYANASDLFSIDHCPEGWDPENTGSYWMTRALTLGISVKF